MDQADLMQILEDLHKELQNNSTNLSTIILIGDHETGEAHYYSSGFKEVQAGLIKMLLDKDKVLANTLYLSAFESKES